MRTEDTSSDEEEENKEKEALNLRSYQQELAAPGLRAKYSFSFINLTCMILRAT
jgi:hypothetical protein